MTYETIDAFERNAGRRQAPRTDFLRGERLVFLSGATAFGAAAGFFFAVAMGRQELATQWLAGAPVLALAFLLASNTLIEAVKRRAYGCSVMAFVHTATLLAWPASMLIPGAQFWMAPVAALSSVLLLASCWTGSSSAIYRAAGQASLVAALAAYQGVLVILS